MIEHTTCGGDRTARSNQPPPPCHAPPARSHHTPATTCDASHHQPPPPRHGPRGPRLGGTAGIGSLAEAGMAHGRRRRRRHCPLDTSAPGAAPLASLPIFPTNQPATRTQRSAAQRTGPEPRGRFVNVIPHPSGRVGGGALLRTPASSPPPPRAAAKVARARAARRRQTTSTTRYSGKGKNRRAATDIYVAATGFQGLSSYPPRELAQAPGAASGWRQREREREGEGEVG